MLIKLRNLGFAVLGMFPLSAFAQNWSFPTQNYTNQNYSNLNCVNGVCSTTPGNCPPGQFCPTGVPGAGGNLQCGPNGCSIVPGNQPLNVWNNSWNVPSSGSGWGNQYPLAPISNVSQGQYQTLPAPHRDRGMPYGNVGVPQHYQVNGNTGIVPVSGRDRARVIPAIGAGAYGGSGGGYQLN